MGRRYHKWEPAELRQLAKIVSAYNNRWKYIQQHFYPEFSISQLRNKHYQVRLQQRELRRAKEARVYARKVDEVPMYRLEDTEAEVLERLRALLRC